MRETCRTEARVVAIVEFTEQVGAEVDRDGIRRQRLQSHELPAKGAADQTRPPLPMDPSAGIGALQFAISGVRPLLKSRAS